MNNALSACLFDLAELQFGYSIDYVWPAIFRSSYKAGVSNFFLFCAKGHNN